MKSNASRLPDLRIRKTRAALARALMEIASEKAFADVTIGEIAARAGIGYATFFRHYADKAALLNDVAGSLVEELTTIIAPALRGQDSAGAALAICQFVDDRRTLCRALLGGGVSADISAVVLDRVMGQNVSHSVALAPELPSELAAHHATASALQVLRWWLGQEDGRYTVKFVAEILDRLALRPIRTG